MFVDISTNGPVGLALFHTFFNMTGVVIFLPFIPVMTRLLVRFLPEQKQSLSVFWMPLRWRRLMRQASR